MDTEPAINANYDPNDPRTHDGFRLYVEKPPKSYASRSSYVPQEGEWCWLRREHEWTLRQRKSDKLQHVGGFVRLHRYEGKMLPAAPPK